MPDRITMMTKLRTSRSTKPRRIGVAVWGIAGALCMLPTGWAQVPDLISSEPGTLNSAQIQTMTDAVDRFVGDLTGSDSKVAREASRDLLAPLGKPQTTRSFRFAYGEVLAVKLGTIIDDTKATPQARISALNILGSNASDAVMAVLKRAIASDEAVIRYAAALGFQRSFEGISNGTHAFGDERQASREMVRQLHQALVAEKSPFVLNAQISACAASSDGAYSLQNLCSGLMTQMNGRDGTKLSPNMISVYENGVQQALKQYINLLSQAANNRSQDKLLVQLGYMVMQLSLLEAEGAFVTPWNRPNFLSLIKSGENLLDVVCNLNADPSVSLLQPTAVSTAFAAEDYSAGSRAIRTFWLKPTGPIYGSRNGFGFPAGSFEKLFE